VKFIKNKKILLLSKNSFIKTILAFYYTRVVT